MLASQDECEIVEEMPSHGKDVVWLENVTIGLTIKQNFNILKVAYYLQ